MIKALIFDMDGTLVDSEIIHYEAWKETLVNHGVSHFPFEEFIFCVGASNEKLARDYIKSETLDIVTDNLVREKQIIYLEMISDMFVVAVPNRLSKHHDFSRSDLIIDSIDQVDALTLSSFSAAAT